jgi:hypothetical protein
MGAGGDVLALLLHEKLKLGEQLSFLDVCNARCGAMGAEKLEDRHVAR